MDNTLLQYEITEWRQLAKCKSNNCPELKIEVCEYIQNTEIEGTKVSVVHPKFGVLFAYTIFPKGDMITDITKSVDEVMTSTILLNELKRYGFYVYYSQEEHLPTNQIQLLQTLYGLHYDKIRVCAIHDNFNKDIQTLNVTAFSISKHSDWVNPGYFPSKAEWEAAILDGSAMNISGLPGANKMSWEWMYNGVYDLDRILARYDSHEFK